MELKEIQALVKEAKDLGEKLAALAERALEAADTGFDLNWNTLLHHGKALAAGPVREVKAE
jgi:hypothetical protein